MENEGILSRKNNMKKARLFSHLGIDFTQIPLLAYTGKVLPTKTVADRQWPVKYTDRQWSVKDGQTVKTGRQWPVKKQTGVASKRHRQAAVNERYRQAVVNERHRQAEVNERHRQAVTSERHRQAVTSERHRQAVTRERHRQVSDQWKTRTCGDQWKTRQAVNIARHRKWPLKDKATHLPVIDED